MHELEPYSASAEVFEGVCVVGAFGVEDGNGRWKCFVWRVVVADDEIDVLLLGVGYFFVCLNAAVEYDDELYAPLAGIVDALTAYAVALIVAVGNVVFNVAVVLSYEFVDECDGGASVNVIVAVDHNLLLASDGVVESVDCHVHILHEEMLSYYVPNLIIQPLVENAVVHGLECKEGGGVVTVSGYATQKKLVILVEDNGVGMEQEKLDHLNEELANVNVKTLKIERTKHRGIALLNINQRIRLHFGTEYGVSIMSTPNVSTTVEIVLPLLVTAEGEK